MNEFEKFLASQPLREIPPEWRSQILPTAEARTDGKAETPAPWWRQLLWPSPVAWACVGCAWVAILGLNAASHTATGGESPALSVSLDGVGRALALRGEILRQFFEAPPEVAAPPRSPRAPGASVTHPAAGKIV